MYLLLPQKTGLQKSLLSFASDRYTGAWSDSSLNFYLKRFYFQMIGWCTLIKIKVVSPQLCDTYTIWRGPKAVKQLYDLSTYSLFIFLDITFRNCRLFQSFWTSNWSQDNTWQKWFLKRVSYSTLYILVIWSIEIQQNFWAGWMAV